MSVPDRVVFDAEPLVAHADGEAGSEAVTEHLDAVGREEAAGHLNLVTASEVRYVLARKYDRGVADEYVEWLWALGVEPVGVDGLWRAASEYVLDYNPPLGDSIALATAEHLDGTLLVGGDGDYDEVDEIELTRFRDGSA